ncbi:hypothetical protein CASFOL_038757 [Castilleja foliolosa]|uniref:Uncharacterized protein n=1 Tax=Castilleja foliolosa TaxID=1961234 RepID=A0ABD3BJF4_9LAMI
MLDKLDKYVTALDFMCKNGLCLFEEAQEGEKEQCQVLAIDEDNVCIKTKEGLKNCKLIAVHAGLEKGKGVEEQIFVQLCNASIAKTFKRRNKKVKRRKQMKKEYSLASQSRIMLNEPRNIGANSFTNDRFVDSFSQQAPINYIPPPLNIGPAIPDHRYPLLGTKRPFSHSELTKTLIIVISGHHGKVHIEEYRLIIDHGNFHSMRFSGCLISTSSVAKSRLEAIGTHLTEDVS